MLRCFLLDLSVDSTKAQIHDAGPQFPKLVAGLRCVVIIVLAPVVIVRSVKSVVALNRGCPS